MRTWSSRFDYLNATIRWNFGNPFGSMPDSRRIARGPMYVAKTSPYQTSPWLHERLAQLVINEHVQLECRSVLVKLHPITFYRTVYLGSARFLGWMPLFFCLPIVSCSLINSLILGCFDNRYLVFYNPSPPRMLLPLALLSEYRIQHGAIGPLYVTSSYSTWIFCRGVSGLATDYTCGVWSHGLTNCLLHVGPPFGNRLLNNSMAVGLTWWIVYLNFLFYFDICNYICLEASYHFSTLSLLLKYRSLFFK